MCSITVVTKLAGSERSFGTKGAESLHRLFRIMRDEKLQTPAKGTHRAFVNIYSYKDASRETKTA